MMASILFDLHDEPLLMCFAPHPLILWASHFVISQPFDGVDKLFTSGCEHANDPVKRVREFQKLNRPNLLGLDCQIQAFCPEIRRI
jgi:hypothetical protein